MRHQGGSLKIDKKLYLLIAVATVDAFILMHHPDFDDSWQFGMILVIPVERQNN